MPNCFVFNFRSPLGMFRKDSVFANANFKSSTAANLSLPLLFSFRILSLLSASNAYKLDFDGYLLTSNYGVLLGKYFVSEFKFLLLGLCQILLYEVRSINDILLEYFRILSSVRFSVGKVYLKSWEYCILSWCYARVVSNSRIKNVYALAMFSGCFTMSRFFSLYTHFEIQLFST